MSSRAEEAGTSGTRRMTGLLRPCSPWSPCFLGAPRGSLHHCPHAAILFQLSAGGNAVAETAGLFTALRSHLTTPDPSVLRRFEATEGLPVQGQLLHLLFHLDLLSAVRIQS